MNMLISNFLLLSNLTCFSNFLLDVRIKNKYIFSLFFILVVMLLTNMNYTNFGLMGTIIMSLFYTMFIFIFFDGTRYKKALITILFILTISISEIFTANLMNSIFNLDPNHINEITYMFALIISNLVTFIILYIMSKLIRKEVMEKHPKFAWLCLALPMTTILFLCNLTNYFSTFRDNILTLVIILGLIISNIIYLVTLTSEIKRMELDNEIKQMRLKYDSLNTQYNTNFYFLHDTIRKLTKMGYKIDENNFTEFKREIMDLNGNLIKSFNTINSNSEMLNILLNYWISDINKYNITVKTVMEYNDFKFISLEDQQYIFSELLRISLDSCKNSNCTTPRITIKTKKVYNQITISCLFSYSTSTCLDLKGLQKVLVKYNGKIMEEVSSHNGLNYFDLLIVFFY